MSDNIVQEKKDQQLEAPLREMMDAGVFYGRAKSRTHPRMKPYILQNRNGVDVINLQKTQETILAAQEILKSASAGGLVLVVVTQPALEDIVSKFATELDLPVVRRRWLGGTLTNFRIIAKRIEHYKKLKNDFTAGLFEKYTKKERVGIERDINRMTELFGGLEKLTRLPDALLIIDPRLHTAAVREARQLHIPIIALTNVDSDPDTVDGLVVGNTRGRDSVRWFLNAMAEVIRLARATPAPNAPAPAEAAKPSL